MGVTPRHDHGESASGGAIDLANAQHTHQAAASGGSLLPGYPRIQLLETAVHAYTGESVSDAIGTATLTNNNGVTFTAGKVGNAWTFDGVNQYLSILNPVPTGLYFTTEPWQIAMWVKTNTVAAGERQMFCITQQAGLQMNAVLQSGSAVIYRTYDAAGVQRNASTGTTMIVAGRWFPVRAWHDPELFGNAGLPGSIYVQVGSGVGAWGMGATVLPGGLLVPTSTILAFGRRGAAAAEYFNGQIDAPLVRKGVGAIMSPTEWWSYCNTPGEHPYAGRA